MNDLRLILLVIGLVLIAIIYLWEITKQRRLQRRQTISQSAPDEHFADIRITPEPDADSDVSGTLAGLNEVLADSRTRDDTISDESIFQADEVSEEQEEPAFRTDTQDMFTTTGIDEEALSRTLADTSFGQESPAAVTEDNLITLHITALPIRPFSGNDILDAVNHVGLEYGDMNIFHHYGIGDMQIGRPLFSLSDMFEPGDFDLEHIDAHSTRGLSMFFCLPVPVDGLLVFELMLNTAQRISDLLGGEIRGPDHNLINDHHIAAMREKISLLT